MYFQEYRNRIGMRGILDLFQKKIEERSMNVFQSYVSAGSPFDRTVKKIYHTIRRSV